METVKTDGKSKTKCGSAVHERPHTQEGASTMRKIPVLLVAVGLMIGLSACGATVQSSVKASTPGVGSSAQSDYGDQLGYHAHQPTEWIEDTPYGY